jgi:hypothetical protein
MERQKIIHIHSVQQNATNDGPKLPTKDQIEYGELAVNYLKDNETVSLRNSSDEIVTLPTQRDITEVKTEITNNEKVVATALNTLNSSAGLNENGKYVAPSDNIILSKASSLADADEKITSAFRYGCTNVTTLANLPIKTRLVYASLSQSESLTVDTDSYSSIFSEFPDGIQIKVIALNSSASTITVTMPWGVDTNKCFVKSLSVNSGEYAVITIDFKSQTEIYYDGEAETAKSGYTGANGIVAFSNGTDFQFIQDKDSNLANFKSAHSDYEPIGIVVIPASCSNILYPEGDVRRGKNIIMSLKAMNYTTPDTGGTTNQYIYWGGYGTDTSLTNYDVVNYYSDGVSSQKTLSTTSYAYLPSDAFTSTASNAYPSIKYYSSSVNAIPSPFKLVSGELVPNEEYYTTTTSTLNALSDFAGPNNTKVLIDLATAQSDWKTINVAITNRYKANYYPSACCCARYGAPDDSAAPKGTHSFLYHSTKNTDYDYSKGVTNVWYMPACGELGFIVPHRSMNDSTMTNVNTVFGSSTAVLLEDSLFWSSSEYSSGTARTVYTANGDVYGKDKGSNDYVRAFCAV